MDDHAWLDVLRGQWPLSGSLLDWRRLHPLPAGSASTKATGMNCRQTQKHHMVKGRGIIYKENTPLVAACIGHKVVGKSQGESNPEVELSLEPYETWSLVRDRLCVSPLAQLCTRDYEFFIPLRIQLADEAILEDRSLFYLLFKFVKFLRVPT